jgi:hypothetical protein
VRSQIFGLNPSPQPSPRLGGERELFSSGKRANSVGTIMLDRLKQRFRLIVDCECTGLTHAKNQLP